jgi:sigma-B regulation protein RsbU (phosphoserine phosphatase)
MLEAIQNIDIEKRMYLRQIATQGTSVSIDLNVSLPEDSFLPMFKGVVIDNSFGGCCILCLTSEQINGNTICRIKIDDLDPIVVKILWVKILDDHVIKLGVGYDCSVETSIEIDQLGDMVKDNRSMLDAISSCTIFNGVDLATIKLLLPQFQFRSLQDGEILITPGQENHSLYLLLFGTLRVYLANIDELSADIKLGFAISSGECIGEMSILEKKPVSAYVVAEGACQIIEIQETMFWERLVTIPRFVKNLLQGLSSRMRKHNEIALQKQLNFDQINRDLKAASKIQANILPQMPVFQKYLRVDVFAKVIPARDVGGDFFDCLELDEHHICIVAGDVSGKGIPAALFMIRVITLVRLMVSRFNSLDAIFRSINEHLCKSNQDLMFVTMFVGIFNVETGKLIYVNGGHNRPFLRRGDRPFELIKVPMGMLLGILETAKYGIGELTLKPADTLVVYTDGVTEAENENQEFLTTETTGKILSEIPSQMGAQNIVESLEKSIFDFSGNVSQSDDITILALRYQ